MLLLSSCRLQSVDCARLSIEYGGTDVRVNLHASKSEWEGRQTHRQVQVQNLAFTSEKHHHTLWPAVCTSHLPRYESMRSRRTSSTARETATVPALSTNQPSTQGHILHLHLYNIYTTIHHTHSSSPLYFIHSLTSALEATGHTFAQNIIHHTYLRWQLADHLNAW